MSVVRAGLSQPCLLLVSSDPIYTTAALREYRRLGWDVYPAQSGPEARRLARMLEPDVVVLDTPLEGESAWLTCAKLTAERPETRVVLVVEDTPNVQQRAALVGASVVVTRTEGLALLQPARVLAEQIREAA
jgi:DNA-binding response OmpR family regulator